MNSSTRYGYSTLDQKAHDWFWVVMIIVILSVLIGKAFGVMPNYSVGQVSGHITQFAFEGKIVKSYEGEMNMGGMRKETDAEGRIYTVPNTIRFTVTNKDLIEKIQKAEENGDFVTLVYDKWFLHPYTVGSPFIIREVK